MMYYYMGRNGSMEHKLDEGMLGEFRTHMLYNEKSSATISKYMRDMTLFYRYMGEDGTVTKEKVIGFKQMLTEQYAPSCTNSMLAAVNGFLKFMGWYDCVVKSLKIQQEAFRPDEKELKKSEYYRLLEAAKEMKNKRLYYVMETIGSTGIRISELKFITVEAVQKRKAKDISHLADLLGHSNVNTTRIYTKLSSGTQERQINLLKLVI